MLADHGFSAPAPQAGAVFGEIGGRRCRLLIPIGEMGDLERLLGVGVWEINERFAAGRLHSKDVAEIVRLGLIGGGECSPGIAQAVVETFVLPRIFEHVRLALDVFMAMCTGVVPLGETGETEPGEAEGRNASPATSGPFTASGEE